MRVLLAPDSFKGSMSAVRVCEIAKKAILDVIPDASVDAVPVADGGEGTVDSFVFACGAQRKTAFVTGPNFGRVNAEFALMGDTAIIEMAQASGLPLAGVDNNPALATTYGTGELIAAALDCGAKKIILGIGGSATNDGGIGCAAALGAKFLDKNGSEVLPNAKGAAEIDSIDLSGMDKRLAGCGITVLCDVENPLYGSNGAAAIFATQKGADSACIAFLDSAMANLERAVKKDIGVDFAAMPGSGAAGGLGYGLRAFFGAQAVSGAAAVLDLCGFDNRAKQADLIITGEGRLDSQSLMGKVPGTVAARSGEKPVAVVCGMSELDEKNKSENFCEVYETNPNHLPFEQVLPDCEKSLYITVRSAFSELTEKM